MAEVTVSVIGYCNLRFVCNLVLEIWDFIFIANFRMLLIQKTYAIECVAYILK
jgi:hypothetical protein